MRNSGYEVRSSSLLLCYARAWLELRASLSPGCHIMWFNGVFGG